MDKLKAVLIGVTGGAVGGLLGIGGAIVLVPMMVYYLGISQHSAHATSLAIIIPGAIFSAAVYSGFGQLDLGLSVFFAIGGMAGAYIGSSLMPKVKPYMLKRIFAVLALVIAIRMGLSL
jgi:uncharacterized membrane protein YfcA